jgi:hypothetical protein
MSHCADLRAFQPVIPDNGSVHRRLRMATVVLLVAATAAAAQYDGPGRPHRTRPGGFAPPDLPAPSLAGP